MRPIITSIIATVTLASILAFDEGPAPLLAGGPKPGAKVTAAEIEKYANDLASASLAVREKAMNHLRKVPGSLSWLRRNIDGNNLNLETRRRMEALIAELAGKRFGQRMTELAKQKGDAPLDLLADLMLENRTNVTEEHWKIMVDIVSMVTENISKDKKLEIPTPKCDYRRCTTVTGSTLSTFRFRKEERVIADELTGEFGAWLVFTKGLAVLSRGLDPFSCVDSLVLINGTFDKDPKRTKREVGFGGCFVYCDGDFACQRIGNCVVIAKGSVSARLDAKNIVIERARKYPALKLFSTDRIGLTVSQEGKGLRVLKVTHGSLPEKCGMKAGDLIQISDVTDDLVSAFERTVRRAYAKDTDLDVCIRRGNQHKKITLSFVE